MPVEKGSSKGKTYWPPPWRTASSEPNGSKSENIKTEKPPPAMSLALAGTTPNSLPAAGCASLSTHTNVNPVDLDSEDSWGAWGTSLESNQTDMITHLKKFALDW
eukprot:3851911-Amphidinium_carterae.2